MWFKKNKEAKLTSTDNDKLNESNGQASEVRPPLSRTDYENDKKALNRNEFVEQYTKSSGDSNEAEELADSIYKED